MVARRGMKIMTEVVISYQRAKQQIYRTATSIWNVYTGLAGSLHDARVLRLSTLWELGTRGKHSPTNTWNIGGVNVGFYILGDSAYPLQNWLLKRYQDTGRLTAEQQTFNKKFSRVRVVVKNAFSRLKGRWHFLMKRNDADLTLVKSMVVT